MILPSPLDLDDLSHAYIALVAHRDHRGRFRRCVANTMLGDLLDDRILARAKDYEASLTARAIGASPAIWGVLSGDEAWHIEGALERLEASLVRHRAGDRAADEAERVRLCLDWLGRLRNGLPLVRARTHLGDDLAREQLTRHVTELVQEVIVLSGEDGYEVLGVAGIESFLPVGHRTDVARVSEIVARNRPARLAVGPDGHGLGLGHIDVPESLRRQGLGTAALGDLCGFANRRQQVITGCFDPSTGAEDWLAKWYERHGFRPMHGRWQRGCDMLRPPLPLG